MKASEKDRVIENVHVYITVCWVGGMKQFMACGKKLKRAFDC